MKVSKHLTKRSLRIRKKWKRKKALYKLKRREIINKMSCKEFPVPGSSRTVNCYWANYYNALKWVDYCKNRWPNVDDSVFHRELPPNKTNVMGPFKHYQTVSANFEDSIEGKTVYNEISNYEDENDEESSSDSEDFVVTEELMTFLEENMKIKACLEKEKLKWNKEDNGEILERDKIDDCKVPTADGELLKRTKEMEDLYGKSAAMIHGMETAVQLTFNRNCDKFRPPNWPILPFKFLFKKTS